MSDCKLCTVETPPRAESCKVCTSVIVDPTGAVSDAQERVKQMEKYARSYGERVCKLALAADTAQIAADEAKRMLDEGTVIAKRFLDLYEQAMNELARLNERLYTKQLQKSQKKAAEDLQFLTDRLLAQSLGRQN